MLQSGRNAPALSPVLLFGFGMRGLPRPVLQAAADLAMAALAKAHPEVFARLKGLSNPNFLIEPVDLPVRFHLCVAPAAPALRVVGEDEAPGLVVAATIRGPLKALIELLEGRVDGDALFFSRTLAVEGDMGAVVALRNAVDGSDVSLFEVLLRRLGPLAGPARSLLGAGGAIYRRAERDLETLRTAVIAPVQRRCDRQDAQLRELGETVSRSPAGRKGRKS